MTVVKSFHYANLSQQLQHL